MSSRDLFEPARRPRLTIAGSDLLFPIRRVFGVGRNYAAHAREMGDDPNREEPFFFTKSPDAVVESGHIGDHDSANGEVARIRYPSATEDLHHEVELVVALHRGGEDLTPEEAAECIYAWAVGNDLTRRDLQATAKEKRRPWDFAKGFDGSAMCTPLLPAADHPIDPKARIWLAVNDQLRQEGTLGQLIWSVPELIASLSRLARLEAGDLIYTGTPAGVGPIGPGDRVTSGVEGVGRLDFEVM